MNRHVKNSFIAQYYRIKCTFFAYLLICDETNFCTYIFFFYGSTTRALQKSSGYEESNKFLSFMKIACSNLTKTKYAKPWGHWKVCPVENFRAPKLVELCVNWPEHSVIKKKFIRSWLWNRNWFFLSLFTLLLATLPKVLFHLQFHVQANI